jgi:hypothetical protein
MFDSNNEIIVKTSDLLCGFISKSVQIIYAREELDEHNK